MFSILHEDLSIDESMVPYYGRHSLASNLSEENQFDLVTNVGLLLAHVDFSTKLLYMKVRLRRAKVL